MYDDAKKNLPSDPLVIFRNWLALAKGSEPNDPEAMALATATAQGRPSVRMVLLKEADENGFKFHSNAESQKGQELLENPHAALCFHWKTLRKQVRIEGKVEAASDKEANAYFEGRPYARKIGAWASAQSRTLENRVVLEEKIKHLEKQYPEGAHIPRPAYWVGYRVVPERVEFWWDNPDRLHDRFVYTRENGIWTITRLYP